MQKAIIIETGNCMYCGEHIDGGDHIFLCEECRRKEELLLRKLQFEKSDMRGETDE